MLALIIKSLSVAVDGKSILKNLNLSIKPGTVHALMGPNGSGKSTLANTLMGHPKYQITKGKVVLNGQDITKLPPDEKAKTGLFLSMQYPAEIAGITVNNFLRNAWQTIKGEKISSLDFFRLLQKKMKVLHLDDSFAQRPLNVGFSGGEKKKMEILQMLILEPKYVILDETDSGLDVDALKTIGKAVNLLKKEQKIGVLVITHYARFLHHIVPDFVHILSKGKIIESGDKKLAKKIERQGFKAKTKVA
ncbi:MAG: Fe-S cluster assembly ATPase SufC [Candidatus Abawacabacteria bacterium]|nr:Fe-S cluster assembly ATPase SufC [Candidatus Abawacabacteria bacterium]